MTAPRPSFSADHPASGRQREAADPGASTWLSANAGSGKTRVLTDRVARLLLAGCDPSHILCLTYTRAAAAEMQTRLFRRLGGWAMKADAALAADLAALGLAEGLGPLDLAQARRLFAQALETPGGLKIQTIHAFCASLLRRFPLEAGVSPQFREMDDRAQALLLAEVAEDLATGPEGPLVEALARHLTDAAFAEMLQGLVARREAFRDPPDDAGLRARLGLPDDATEASLLAALDTPERRQLLRDAAALCAAGSSTDARAASRLDRLGRQPRLGLDHLEALEGVLLTGADAKTPFAAKVGSFPTKATRARDPALAARLEDLMRDVEACRDRRLGLVAHARNRDLHAFAHAFVAAYEARKAARGLLDFDDLIARARALLTDPSVAQWVLWRLDGGIDHILVDEAQDTSPGQWAVIERLAAEFAAGEAREPARPRTLFVVGDRKQSIYSFQGADAEAFERMRAHFDRNLADAGRRLEARQLEYSFRSAEAVLRVVDETFRDARGLGDAAPAHLAYKAGMPGRVDLWDPVAKPDDPPEDVPWTEPVDAVHPRHEALVLAEAVARAVEAMIARETLPVEVDGVWMRRPVTAGDVMILVQRRQGLLYGALNRALKARGLDVAGADRQRLGAELAVRDVEAVLRVLALPDDDLALACALRSPLFGWDERRLYRLASPRPEGQTLWQALEAAGDEATLAIWRDLRARADYLRPFELASRLLVRHDGRRRLLARLGPEAEDGLDAFLAQALAYESQAVPSLTGFLEWRARDESEVKRQMDAAGERIRVMTVHGAKGLEAPIVILPDCADRKAPKASPLVPMPDGAVLWGGARDTLPEPLRRRREALLAAQEEERRRLLYVAMTRAEAWLVVCAAGACGERSWHGEVARALDALEAAAIPCETGAGRRYGGGWDHLPTHGPTHGATRAAPPDPPPPPAAFGPVDPPGPHAAARAATDLGGAKILPDDDDDADGPDPEAARARAMARGHLVHLALEHLPATDPATALALLAATPEAALAGDLAAIVADAQALVAAPGLAPLFAPDALAEVSLTGEVEGLGRVHGTIDRLLVGADAVTIVDFKTNRRIPATPDAVPEGILRQMGAYAALAATLWPGRTVRPAILWTHGARLMPLPRDLVAAALRRATAPAPSP